MAVPVPTVGTTAPEPEPEPPTPPEPKKFWSWRLSKKSRSSAQAADDPEKGSDPRNARPVRLLAPIYSGLGLGLAICESVPLDVASAYLASHPVFVASGFTIMLQEFRLDQDYTRFALVAIFPFLVCVSLVRLLFPVVLP